MESRKTLLFLISFTYLCSTVNCWSYHDQKSWVKLTEACNGRHQSPVNIVTKKIIKKSELNINFHNYDQMMIGSESMIMNNGHTVQVTPETERIITINGSTFGNETYQLIQFHFHWSHSHEMGTEHAIDGSHYAAEIHFVHQNVRYNDLNEAGKHKDGFAVLGVIYEVKSRDNINLAPLINQIPNILYSPTTKPINENLSLESLLPKSLNSFYTYNGSFTTPPCHESVTWVMFKEFLPIGQSQLNQLRRVHEGNKNHSEIIDNNIRDLQEINDRIIFSTDAALNIIFNKSIYLLISLIFLQYII